MGKSNRIRTQRAEINYSTPLKSKKKKGMPSWLVSLIAIVITLAVLGTVVVSMFISNGTVMRISTALSSDNYKINGNMMAYYYKTQYIQFYNSYSSYMQYFSLDTSKPFKDQTYGVASTEDGYAYETSFLGSFDGTWFDYFMSLAKEQAKQILIYCEEADARNIKLDSDDKAEIDEAVKTIEETASSSGYSITSYLANMYGSGIKVRDIRKAMEYSALATKCSKAIQDEISGGIGESDVNTKYEGDRKSYNLIDYDTYTIKVVYEDIAKELLGADYTDAQLEEKKTEVLDKYKEKIAEAKAVIEEFKSKTDAADFEKALYEKLAADYFDSKYSQTSLADEKKLNETDLVTVKNAMVKKLVEEMIAGASETTGDSSNSEDVYTIYGVSVSSEAAELLDTAKSEIFKSLTTDKGTYILEAKTYIKDDDFSIWAFADGRALNDTNAIYSGDGATDGSEITNTDGHFYANAYIITKPEYRDTSLTKNIGYLIFESETDATAAIDKFKNGTVSKEAFEQLIKDTEATGGSIVENYKKGNIGYDEFDNWLFDSERKPGAYTDTSVKLGDKYYAVIYYYADGKEVWYANVYNAIVSEKYETYYNDIVAKYAVTVKDKVINKVDD